MILRNSDYITMSTVKQDKATLTNYRITCPASDAFQFEGDAHLLLGAGGRGDISADFAPLSTASTRGLGALRDKVPGNTPPATALLDFPSTTPYNSCTMSSAYQKMSGFFLRTLGRKVSLKGLPHLQPVFLLQILIGVSQALNGGAAQAEALARGLVLDGQRRLSELRNAAPQVSLSLEQLLKVAHANKRDEEDLSAEESAVQALLEVCLGLMLRLLSKKDQRWCPSLYAVPPIRLFCYNARFPFVAFPLILPLRARACPILQSQ